MDLTQILLLLNLVGLVAIYFTRKNKMPIQDPNTQQAVNDFVNVLGPVDGSAPNTIFGEASALVKLANDAPEVLKTIETATPELKTLLNSFLTAQGKPTV